MLLYFLYQYCRRLEEADFQGKPADMAYMLMVLFSTTSEFFNLNKIFLKFILSRRRPRDEHGRPVQSAHYCCDLRMVQFE